MPRNPPAPSKSDASSSHLTDKPSRRRTHYSLMILTLITMSHSIDRQLIGAVLEPIKKEFLVTDTQMGLLAGLWFALFYAAGSIPIARIADKGSRRNVLAACCAVWSFMTILCGMAANYWQLALARTGVAIGEAGNMPTSLSMVADYYPKEQRPLAMSVFIAGPFAAVLFALAGGAWIAQQYGWRMAFIVAGALGLALALLMRITVPEPRRGAWDRPVVYAQVPLLQTLHGILSSAAFRYLTLANGLAMFWFTGMTTWNISFLIRSHGMELKYAGLLIGMILTFSMILGALLSGWLCTRLVKRDVRWQIGIPLIGAGLTIPASLAYFLWPAGSGIQFLGIAMSQAMIFFMLMGFFSSWVPATSVAALSNIISAHQRAVANAVYVVFFTVLGFGIGPVSVGMLSDVLVPFAGKEGLRYALAALSFAMVLSMLFYAKALKPYLEANK